jgi:GPH family glycoside/pentoside/hexuronide:cation symporter
VVGFAPFFATIIQLLRKAWDAVNDPLIGTLNDRSKGRWGRRKSFMVYGIIPYGILFALLWQTPQFSTYGNLLWFIFLVFAYDTAMTLVWIPYNAITPELTEDYNERTNLNGYRQIFSMLAGLMAVASMDLLGKYFTNQKEVFSALGCFAAIAIILSFLVVLWGVKEKPFQPKTKHETQKISVLFKETFSNKAFVIAVGIFFFSWVAIGIGTSMVAYFVKYWMHIDAMYILLAIQLTALLAIPLLVFLSGKIGKKLTFIFGISFWAVVQLSMLFLQPDQQIAAVVLAAFAGIGIGAAHVIPWALIPDCIDAGELQHGKRQEGAYYGVLTFMEKAGSALALGGVGIVLQFAGYSGNQPSQPESAIWAIRLLMSMGPAIFLILSIIIAFYYPLSKKRHDEIRRQLSFR